MEERVALRQTPYPIPTLVMMGSALLVALMSVDWTGSGQERPIWVFLLPPIFGSVGSLLGLARRDYSWATASAILGLGLLPMPIILTLLVDGM
ncbi:hypothetical protein [Glutamicibacter creatinolyticus]|uniref:hypothetical protein n=1 Tax=Glutamicibacter creatinolyticus TaxID=162496 RepID=UPI003216F077